MMNVLEMEDYLARQGISEEDANRIIASEYGWDTRSDDEVARDNAQEDYAEFLEQMKEEEEWN